METNVIRMVDGGSERAAEKSNVALRLDTGNDTGSSHAFILGKNVEIVEDACDEDPFTPTLFEAPEITSRRDDVQLGQLWALGPHRLLVDDSLNADNIDRLMDGSFADIVFTDPPYELDSSGGNLMVNYANCGTRMKDVHRKLESVGISKFDPEKLFPILKKLFRPNHFSAFIFPGTKLRLEYENWAKSNGFSTTLLIWDKVSGMPIGDHHCPDIEPLLFMRLNAKWNDVETAPTAKRTRCWEHNRQKVQGYGHPSPKPSPLIENQLLLTTGHGDIVVDLFGGSGSTLMACVAQKRRCFIAEHNPEFASVIINRYEEYTKDKAVLLTTS